MKWPSVAYIDISCLICIVTANTYFALWHGQRVAWHKKPLGYMVWYLLFFPTYQIDGTN